jgi:hypothetical protein
VNDQPQDICPTPVNQGVHAATSQPNKIGPATPYDFDSKNLTAYGGLLPVGTLLEKLGFRQLVEETLKVKRQTLACPLALLIRHQKYDNHPDGQNEHNVGEEVQHLSTGRFPVNQIRRKASWTENICCRLWNYLAAQRARGATKRGAVPHIRHGALNRSCARRVGHPEG